jgi:hypothetical protein
MKHWSLLVVAMAMTGQAFAQLNQGPLATGNAVNSAVAGSVGAWTNVANVQDLAPSFAFSPDLATAGSYTDRIFATGFGFTIPAGSTITGIEVTVARRNSTTVPAPTTLVDREVYLVKGGVVQDGSGQNQANTTGFWPQSTLTGSYGGDSDLWNNTWTVADINSPDFGMVISVQQTATTGVVQQARIAAIRIRVWYTSSLPIRLKSFDLKKTDKDQVDVSFVTTQEVNVSDYEIQRSSDGRKFETIGRIKPETPNSELERRYAFTDESPLTGMNLYRLKQNDLDGKYEIFPVRSIKINGLTSGLRFVQSGSGTVRISGIRSGGTYNLLVRDTNGRLLQNVRISAGGLQTEASVNLKPGVKGVVIMSLVNDVESRSVKVFIQ